MLFGRAIPGVLGLVAGLGGVSLSASAASESAAAVPADLQVLVGHSQHLQVPYLISTEHAGFSGRGDTAALVTQSRASPQESATTLTTAIGFTTHVRYLRGEFYLEPSQEVVSFVTGLRSRLHDRRWISLTRREVARDRGVHTWPLIINPVAPNPLASTGLAPLVAIETNIVEAGPATVDGQPVTEFTGRVDPSQLPKNIRENFSGVDAPASVAVVLDIAPDGLLKRVKLTGTVSGMEFAMIGKVLSISDPVMVHRPSPRDTISAATLTRTQVQELGL